MFSIHPAELERRRARCRPVVESLRHLRRESIALCNLCGSGRNAILAVCDRYGFSARTAMCLDCGLIYLADRLTPEGYTEFYARGAYRSISSGFNGADPKISGLQLDQLAYAAHAIASVEHYIPPGPGRLLDVGGSTGIVARQFADHFGLTATVLDPAVREVAHARSLGLDAVIGSLESFETSERYQVILLCRSVEHLCDLRGALAHIRELLAPGGVLYCDVVDYLEDCRVMGAPQVVSKMDHCFWLCQETAPGIFRALGFEIVSVNVAYEPGVIGYVLRRGAECPAVCPPETVDAVIRRLREIDADWRRLVRVPYDFRHRVRRAGYQLKRQLRRMMIRAAAGVSGLHSPDLAHVRAAIRRILNSDTHIS